MRLSIFSVFCFGFLSFSGATNSVRDDTPPVRAVSLGGWLVAEGWIKPSLFSKIPNKDFLDGTGMQLKSAKFGKYLSAESGGGGPIVANRTEASGWETFTLWRMNETSFKLRVFNRNFLGVSRNSHVVAVANTSDEAPGVYEIHTNPRNSSLIRIKAPNGLFIQAKSEDLVSADNHQGDGTWRTDDPSVFIMTIVTRMQGEYQITNGYGPILAPKVMQEHWNTFILEKDFEFIKKSGLNAVRFPVGWWTAHDPNPPKPYVAGSLHILDKAFVWAEKYKIRVILDLHAAPGSQNGMEHSSSRDGTIEFGQTDENIKQTVEVIDFFTSRYAKSKSLFAVELLNEPLAPEVSLTNLTKYYQGGYDAVRKHSQTAYVVLSNRLSINASRELFELTKGMKKAVIDVHYYNLFWDYYSTLTVDQNIEYVRINRTAELQELTTTNGPLIFVGEWVAELPINTTKDDIVRYGEAQLEVFKNATFGWSYWTVSNVNDHWNLTWMVTNGYINLTRANY